MKPSPLIKVRFDDEFFTKLEAEDWLKANRVPWITYRKEGQFHDFYMPYIRKTIENGIQIYMLRKNS